MNGVLRVLRFVPVVFLGFWLCGWAAGEYFVGRILFAPLLARLAPGLPGHVAPLAPDSPVFVLVFMGAWFALWTFGGLMAAVTLLGLAFGTPVVRWNDRRVESGVLLGRFFRGRRVPLERVSGVTVDAAGSIVVAGAGRSMVIPGIPERADAEQLATWLREAVDGRGEGAPPVTAIG